MKALKILGGTVGMLVLAVAVFWVGWLRAPSAEDVCDNIAAVAKKETKVEMGPAERQACLRSAQPPEFGRVPWVRQMKCLRDAQTMAEIAGCER
jgi:hypothetical protein